MIRLISTRLLYLAAKLHQICPPLGVMVKTLNHLLTGADISASATIGPDIRMYHPTGVVIGPRVRLGNSVTVQQGVTLGHGRGGSPQIGDGVHLGPGVVVVGNYSVGAGSVIGANAVVTSDVPPREIWAGVPARRIRSV